MHIDCYCIVLKLHSSPKDRLQIVSKSGSRCLFIACQYPWLIHNQSTRASSTCYKRAHTALTWIRSELCSIAANLNKAPHAKANSSAWRNCSPNFPKQPESWGTLFLQTYYVSQPNKPQPNQSLFCICNPTHKTQKWHTKRKQKIYF